jgi:hypothetical protein
VEGDKVTYDLVPEAKAKWLASEAAPEADEPEVAAAE